MSFRIYGLSLLWLGLPIPRQVPVHGLDCLTHASTSLPLSARVPGLLCSFGSLASSFTLAPLPPPTIPLIPRPRHGYVEVAYIRLHLDHPIKRRERRHGTPAML